MHHSIAYLVLSADNVAGREHRHRQRPAPAAASPEDLVNRRPQLMEWAIGKGYDLLRRRHRQVDHARREDCRGISTSTPSGEEVDAGSEIALWLYPKGQEPTKRSYLIGFTGLKKRGFLDIAPNSMAYTEGFTVLKENTMITNFQPHFHLRGKAMEVKAILPDGSTQVVSYVGKFNFNWMTNYIYADDAAPVFPKGTVIQVSAWYDNTKNNPNNPDPDQWVGYGDRTVDEMAHAWMNVVYLTDAEYKEWQDKKKAADHRRRPRSSNSHASTSRGPRAPRERVGRRVCLPNRSPSPCAASAPASPRRTRDGSTTPTARTTS